MTIRNLAEVRVRLEEALDACPEECATPADTWNRLEMLCIAELDSIHDQLEFAPEPLLQEYLAALLQLKRLELGLPPD